MCLATDEIDQLAGRVGLAVEPGSRTLPDGRRISWRGAGIDDPNRTPDLPFFIAWDRETPHPSQDSPAGCTLLPFEIQHTDSQRLRTLLADLLTQVSAQGRPQS
jgi:hypothetical protein